jgi:phytoene dehydrogenase-like protein
MEITDQLLRPFVEKLEAEWRGLYRDIASHAGEEADAMKAAVEQRMRQLEKFRLTAHYYEKNESETGLKEFPNLREALRFLKMDLRTVRRKWRRHLVSKIRTQKRQERATHGASIAV